jgi:hypothetical protein
MTYKLEGSNRIVEEMVAYPPQKVKDIVIPEGSAYSEPFNFNDAVSLAVVSGDEWTDSDLAFQVSADRQTWITLTDQAGEIIKCTGISSGANWVRPFPDAMMLYPFPYIRLMTVNTATNVPVNQGGTRYMKICMK